MQPIALYVHIPFCETKCPYCDFNTYAKIESLIPDYVAALRTEIELWGGLLDGPPVRTVFFGGGTPSYLPSGDISALMATISGSFALQDDAEITLEANPGDFTPDKLNDFLDAGINRLSIGVQSFDDGLLTCSDGATLPPTPWRRTGWRMTPDSTTSASTSCTACLTRPSTTGRRRLRGRQTCTRPTCPSTH